MNDKIRKTVPLVGALALTASALLAGSGAALAAKADPTASLDTSSSYCTGNTYVRASFDVDAKGRWVHARAWLVVDETERDVKSGRLDKNSIQLDYRGPVPSATAYIEFRNRWGETLTQATPLDVC